MTTMPEPEVRVAGPNPWLALVCLGVLTIAVGVWIMLSGDAKLATVAILLAVGLFLNALTEFVWATDRSNPAVGYTIGALLLVGGIIVLFQPGTGLRALAIVIGIILISIGLLQAAVAVAGRQELRHWVWLLVFALITIGIGIAAIVWPKATIKVIGFLFGLRLVLIGIGMTGVGLDLKRLND